MQVSFLGLQRLSAVLAVLSTVSEAQLPAVPGTQPAPGSEGAGRHRGHRLRVEGAADDV